MKHVEGNVDPGRAQFVKHLRVERGLSYRAVHKHFQLKYMEEEDWYVNKKWLDKGIKPPHGNIIIGVKLCHATMKLLGENWNE